MIAGRAIILRAAIILEELWEKYDKWLSESTVPIPRFGSEQLSSLLRQSPFSTFLMKHHINGRIDLSDFPQWNLSFRR